MVEQSVERHQRGGFINDHIEPLVANVHEGKSPNGIVCEKPPLEPLTVLALPGVLPQCFDHLDFRLLEELVIGDFG